MSAYDFAPLANAAKDAGSVATLLAREFRFSLSSARALIDGEADRETLRRRITDSLDRGDADSRWLFYFAGHGEVVDGKGYLLPADARRDDPTGWLAVEWLMDKALASRHREVLLVLDMCYAGRALMKRDVESWLEDEAQGSLGTVQLLVSGGPWQTVLDGVGDHGHSPFCCSLLEVLRGEAGIHDEQGAVRFTPLVDELDRRVERLLRAARVDPGRQQLLGVTLRASLRGNVKGDFRFRPRGCRLPPSTVEGVLYGDAVRRRRSLAELPERCAKQPREFLMPERLDWNLPLALTLALDGLPRGRMNEERAKGALSYGDEIWEVRDQRARTLGKLGELVREPETRETSARAIEPLLHLALRDADPVVRWTAARGLARAQDAMEQREVGERLADLGREAARSVRWRVWRARAALPEHRRQLSPVSRAAAGLTAGAVTMGTACLRAVRDRRLLTWIRGALLFAGSVATLLYGLLWTSYYLSTDSAGYVVVRRGLPGYEAVPGIGDVAVFTGHHAGRIVDGSIAAEERLNGTWLWLEDGVFTWGPRLAERLKPGLSGLELWRLGDSEAALERLRRGISLGQAGCVRTAAYLALHSDEVAETVLELVVEALGSDDGSVRAEADQALRILRQARPGFFPAVDDRVLDKQPVLPKVAPSVAAALADDVDPEVVIAAALVADRLPEEDPLRGRVADRLRRIVRDGAGYRLRLRAMETLVGLTGDGSSTIELLRGMAADPDGDVRARAIGFLVEAALDGRADPAAVAQTLRSVLGDQLPGIRQEAAQGILLLADRGIAPPYEKAFEEVSAEIFSADRGWNVAEGIGRRFTAATPAASVRFGRRLLEEIPSRDEIPAQQAFRSLEAMVVARPEVLPSLTPALVALLATPGETDLPWRTAWFLRTLRVEHGLDLTAVRGRLLDILRDGSGEERRGAAYGLGVTVASPPQARRVLRVLEETLDAGEPGVATRAAFSLEWISRSFDGLADKVLPLLLRGLKDDRPEVRSAFARALSESAEGPPPSLGAIPPEVRAALEDADPGVRSSMARALGLWGRRRAVELAGVVPWIEDRLVRERDPLVRIRLASTLGVLAGGDAGVAGRVRGLLVEGLPSERRDVRESALGALGRLAEVHADQAEKVADLIFERRSSFDSSLRRLAVLVLRGIGRAHPEGAVVVLDPLGALLVEDDDVQVRWSALHNGLKPVVTAHPFVAPEVVSRLEEFLKDGKYGANDHLASAAWKVWTEAAVEPAARDLDLLWRRLESSGSFYRNAALATLVRLVAERPEKLAAIESGLERRRRSTRPEVRRVVSMAAESIEILRPTLEAAGDPLDEAGWKATLDWIPADFELQAAIEEARRRLAEGG